MYRIPLSNVWALQLTSPKAAILCAQCRGDAVARLVHDITSGRTKEEVRELFSAVREAITIAVPFVGLPNCMPACFGMVKELKQWGIEKVEGPRRWVVRRRTLL